MMKFFSSLSTLFVLILCPFLAESQCSQLVESTIVSALSNAGVDITSISDQHNLCEAGSKWIRMSLLFNGNSAVAQTARASFACKPGLSGFVWLLQANSLQSDLPHIDATQYSTVTDCSDCNVPFTDSFGDPSWCNVQNHPCGPAPCLNGGSCVWSALRNYTCSCVDHWTGFNCEICGLDVAMCVNGNSVDSSTCTCQCSAPLGVYAGVLCDQCTITPALCTNGDTVNTTSCTCDCPGQFTGTLCASCPLTASSCENGGTLSSPTCECECQSFTSGTLCDVCELSCANQGTLTASNCSCTCPAGYEGRNCTAMVPGAARPCNDLEFADVQAQCAVGFSANRTFCTCQRDDSPHFVINFDRTIILIISVVAAVFTLFMLFILLLILICGARRIIRSRRKNRRSQYS